MLPPPCFTVLGVFSGGVLGVFSGCSRGVFLGCALGVCSRGVLLGCRFSSKCSTLCQGQFWSPQTRKESRACLLGNSEWDFMPGCVDGLSSVRPVNSFSHLNCGSQSFPLASWSCLWLISSLPSHWLFLHGLPWTEFRFFSLFNNEFIVTLFKV